MILLFFFFSLCSQAPLRLWMEEWQLECVNWSSNIASGGTAAKTKGSRNKRSLWWQTSENMTLSGLIFKHYLHGLENTSHPWFHGSSIYLLYLTPCSVQYCLFSFCQHWETNLPLGLPSLHFCTPIFGIHFSCCRDTKKF